jgi:eukaryotic-like serine/threonine-protein kinase
MMKSFFKKEPVRALINFFSSKVFWKHFLIAFGSLSIVLIVLFIWLKIYTHHGKAYAVPDFYGMHLEEVDQITQEKKLRFKVVDSVFNSMVDPGTVVDQNPFPGFKVKVNRTIFLTVNATSPEMVKMPNLIGVSLRQAKAILETQGLEVGRLRYVPDIALNNVLKQLYEGKDIETGAFIVKGSFVDLVLGQGVSSVEVPLPDFTGYTYERARGRVIDSYFNIGAMIFDHTVENEEDTLASFVWRQRPSYSYNATIRLGSTVDLWFTKDSSLLPVVDTLPSLIPDFDEEYP